jgi:hypothetical protein
MKRNYNFPVFSWNEAWSVGTENNDARNFTDSRGTGRNPKSLKRNNEARKGILIAPSKLPRFSRVVQILHALLARKVGFGPEIRGTDGKPTLHLDNLQAFES